MQGLLNKEISTKMNITANTVKNYIYNIYQKTKVDNRVELLHLFFPKEI
jgi:DNA-binding NarL/FixJ family response regulator